MSFRDGVFNRQNIQRTRYSNSLIVRFGGVSLKKTLSPFQCFAFQKQQCCTATQLNSKWRNWENLTCTFNRFVLTIRTSSIHYRRPKRHRQPRSVELSNSRLQLPLFETNPSYHPKISRRWNMRSSLFTMKDNNGASSVPLEGKLSILWSNYAATPCYGERK